MKTRIWISAGIFTALCAATGLGRAQILPPPPTGHTNGPPAVRILTPQEGEAFLLGQNIPICAAWQNFTDAVARVEFFAGATSLGVVTNSPFAWGIRPIRELRMQHACLTWSNAAAGDYTLTAQATDLAGISVTSAPVDISVVTNLPPVVRIVRPRNDAVILGPTNILICASAFDRGGQVTSVTFFEGTKTIGVVTNTPPIWMTNWGGIFPIRQSAYCLTWSNVPPGAYTLTAVAVDNSLASSTSAPVNITVVTNLPPLVRIIRPFNGARFFAPADIGIEAAAADPSGTVASVEFFEDGKSIGVVTTGTTETNWWPGGVTVYGLTWSNVPPASYTLTAVATDTSGATGTSLPVQVTVVAPPPPLVKIIYPPNGARYYAPANIYIATVTEFFTNPVADVEFWAGTNILGVVTNSSWPTFHWTNVPPGAYSLTALATDTGGNNATSAPVNVTVLTNRPPRRPIWMR